MQFQSVELSCWFEVCCTVFYMRRACHWPRFHRLISTSGASSGMVPVMTVMEGCSRSMFPGTRSELAAFSPANSPCSYIEEPQTSITSKRTNIRNIHLSSDLWIILLYWMFLLDFRLIRKKTKIQENTTKEPKPASLRYKIAPAVPAVIGRLLSQVALPQI